MKNEGMGYTAESRFTGGAFANFFIELISIIVSIVTLGLAYPAMACWKLRWKMKHTYVNGRQLAFDGRGIQLFGSFLLWMLLSVVTLGIYAIFAMPLNMKRWETKHTHFAGVENGESKFDGTIWGLFGVNFITNFVTIITLSLGSYWAHCYRERWYKKHQVIDGCRFFFDGKGIQYFGKCFVWTLLTIITFGIYSFWLVVNQEKWTVSHTHMYGEPISKKSIVSEPKTKPAKVVAPTQVVAPVEEQPTNFTTASVEVEKTWNVTCPYCKQAVTVADGETANCPFCGKKFGLKKSSKPVS